MSIIKKLTIATAITTALTGIAFANGGTVMPQPCNHSIFVGIGGGYSNTQFDHDYSATVNVLPPFTTATPVLAESVTAEDESDNLAPTLRVGYLQQTSHPNFFWGVEGVYTYLNSSTDSGNFNSFFRTKANNLLSLLLLAGTNIDANNTVTFGIGPAVAELQQNVGITRIINNPFTGNTSTLSANDSQSKAAWGGTAQLGLQHYFNPNWFVAADYDYTLMARRSFQQSFLAPNGFEAISLGDSVRMTTQQVMVTLNRSFS